jgi:flagellar hook-associated protein FlgK
MNSILSLQAHQGLEFLDLFFKKMLSRTSARSLLTNFNTILETLSNKCLDTASQKTLLLDLQETFAALYGALSTLYQGVKAVFFPPNNSL